MVRMAKFAKENPDLKPIPLIKAYNDKYPEVTMEQKLANIRNWLDDNEVMAVAEADNECATLPLQRVSNSVYCECTEKEVLMLPHSNTPYCAECGKNIKQ